MKIGTREVGPGAPVFIIAECGSNHGGSLDAALALIDAAADAGADAAKFQYFRVDRFIVARENPESLRKYELPDEWLPKLKARCEGRGIEFLCTAFDRESLRVIDPFVNAHKVGSWEAADFEYGGDVLDLGKPTMFSLGVSRPSALVNPPWRYDRTILLLCESKYPAPIDGYLRDENTILIEPWGVSDHTLDPTTVPAAAVALGACVVEKHMRLGRRTKEAWTAKGDQYTEVIPEPDSPDLAVSIDVLGFASMVRAIRLTESAIRG